MFHRALGLPDAVETTPTGHQYKISPGLAASHHQLVQLLDALRSFLINAPGNHPQRLLATPVHALPWERDPAIPVKLKSRIETIRADQWNSTLKTGKDERVARP